jgi:hypothetical protein
LSSGSKAFVEQAAHCDGRSPLYASLCRRFADDAVAAELADDRWDFPLRLLGGLHYLVLAGEASWDDPLERHADFLLRFTRERDVQTNEVQRSWVLAPLFLRVCERTGASDLHLIELGPSAGLNLVWDRYRYRYGAGDWGPADAPLELRGTEAGAVPKSLLALRPRVRDRVGIDRRPIDVTTEEGARLLECWVWAGQEERMKRLRRAIDAAREDPPQLVQGDFVDALPRVVADAPADALPVVFQTGALRYVEEERRPLIGAALEQAERPLAFVSAGSPRSGERVWGLRIVYWPGGEREFVGHADYHGAWLDWSPE